MQQQRFCNEEEDENEPSNNSKFRWWKSALKIDEIENSNADLSPSSMSAPTLTPKLKVLREMERLSVLANGGLDDVRSRLITYRAGDLWAPIGGMTKDDMEIPAVITILLVGFSGSGKTSLVNFMYRVLGRTGLFPFAQTSDCRFMEEHNVLRSMRSGFCIFDSKGFGYDQVAESLDELSRWMDDGIHHNQLCYRSRDGVESMDVMDFQLLRASSKFVKRKVNCVMVVANVAEIYKALQADDPQPLEAIREVFCSSSLRTSYGNPILILTQGDKLPADERIDGRLKICESLGISETMGVYDISCVTEYGVAPEVFDPVAAYSLAEAVYMALLISDGSHLPKHTFKDTAFCFLSWFVCFLGTWLCSFLAALFAFLAQFFSDLGHRNKPKS
ncbi:hypothetical protein Nepgr_029668 [Nepenthes gracilis]|uniref:P-loop containing nucleoside triphosphate hydrolases superfamily protein n=1 Tax=Nepenthes gracilis TaxID=150966 RepID=A0AAD3Y523_NEPGR|nr:hypothetical protein Nepgr_029668 [Nepenthes gracilis]